MKVKVCDEFYFIITNNEQNIYELLNTSNENILRNNNEIKIYEGEWIKVKVNKFITHHVKPMQTIEDVAKIYNLTTEKIVQDNQLSTNKLFIGQRIKIYK